MANTVLPPVHPGRILREEYLEPLGMSAGGLAKAIGVPRTRVERLAAEKTAMTTDSALRLARYFRTSPEFWMNLQTSYSLKLEGLAIESELDKVVPLPPLHQAA